MPNKHAQALGRLGGKVTSEAKAVAARKNAKKGGWPKGKKRGKTPRRGSARAQESNAAICDGAK